VLPQNPEESRLLSSAKDALKTENIRPILGRGALYLGSWLLQLVLIMFVVFFLLLEGKMLTLRVVEIFGPSTEAQSRAVSVLSEIAGSVRAYLVWRTVVNIGWRWCSRRLSDPGPEACIYLGNAGAGVVLCAVHRHHPRGVPPVLDAFVFVGPGTALGILIFTSRWSPSRATSSSRWSWAGAWS